MISASLTLPNILEASPTFRKCNTAAGLWPCTFANSTPNSVNNANGFWEFTGTGYAVGSHAFVTSSIDTIADTGTTLLLMDDSVVSAYYSKVSGAAYDSTQGGYTFPCSTTLPSFTLGIGSYMAVIPGTYMNYAPTTGSCKSSSASLLARSPS